MTKVKDTDQRIGGCPGRRGVLLGLGLAGGLPGAAAFAARAASMTGADAVPATADSSTDRQPFLGPHQAGIVTTQPAAALFVAFDVLADQRQDLARLLQTLTERIDFLMKGGPATVQDAKLPPLDSGLLGSDVPSDNLTITVSVGASLFDENRFGLMQQRPRSLVQMTRFANDALDAEQCHGDLLLQFCANTPQTNIHALRDILKALPDLLALRWKLDGFLPPRATLAADQATPRNLLGFKDGTANPDTRDGTLMDKVVWVRDGAKEPAWAVGGTYQVVRIIRMLVERWDRTPLQEQQTIFGRDKASGAPLGRTSEHDDPDYQTDLTGARIPLTAHIRLANPRTEATAANLMLRRGYNFSRGLTKAGQLDMGLVFVSFQADLAAGFLTVQSRLNGEPLEEYIKPVGGGYFFALPGVQTPEGFLGEGLFSA